MLKRQCAVRIVVNSDIFTGNNPDVLFAAKSFILYAAKSDITILVLHGSIANPGTVESHFGDLLFNSGFVGFISVSELKYAVTVTAAEPVVSFRVLLMTLNLSRLATGTMNNNAGHE